MPISVAPRTPRYRWARAESRALMPMCHSVSAGRAVKSAKFRAKDSTVFR